MRSTRSDSRARYRLALPPALFLLFFYRPSNWNWVVTSPVGGFSRQIPENPRRDRWPPPEHPASSKVVKGRAVNCDGEWEREGGAGGRGTWHREDGEVYSTSILSYSSYPLAISPGISPSCLIELVVYTYTTHNDSSVGKKGVPLFLSFCLSLPFSLSLPQYLLRRGTKLENAGQLNEVKQGDSRVK